jgi:hypothetical protein
MYIDFDPTILQFTGFTSTVPNILISGNNTQGRVSVAYSSLPPGASINSTFLNLNFNYNGTGSSDLIFTGQSEVTYTNLDPVVVSFDNGKVEPLATAYQLTIEDESANPGNPVVVDITAAGYPSNVGAVTLFIGYNPAHLTFTGLSNGTIIGASANVVSAGLLGISWTNMLGQSIDGIIFSLNFEYNFGSSDITFEGGSVISNLALVTIPTTFNDGSISPITGGPEVNMPVKTGTVGQPINFPVRAKNFSMDIAAISLFIGYNNSVLTYTGHTPGTISGYFINNIGATSQIGVQWSMYPAVNIDPNGDDTLFTLHFNYNGGVCDLTFDGGCEFAKADLTKAPVSYFDGAVITGSRFDVKVYLEGPFNGTTMNTTLNAGGFLPLAQPFNVTPWNYMGTESVAVIPSGNVIDWVLLEVRETAGAAATATSATIVARQAAFLLNDGSIVAIDGSSEVLIPTSFTDNVYVVVYHRNHVPAMSATALTFANDMYAYDFTTAQGQAYNNGQKALTSVAALYAGDGDGNGFVQNFDLFFIWMNQVGSQGYYGGDFDLNTFVQNFDLFFFWMANVGVGSTQVP